LLRYFNGTTAQGCAAILFMQFAYLCGAFISSDIKKINEEDSYRFIFNSYCIPAIGAGEK
jgi:hypothetical protein